MKSKNLQLTQENKVSDHRGTSPRLKSDNPAKPANALSSNEFDERLGAYVRYLIDTAEGVRQWDLAQAGSPPPEKAKAVSTGIYFLTAEQEDRIHWNTPPARLGQGIAKQIQDECNESGRTAYAVVAESDALEPSEKTKAQTIIDWLSRFAENWLGIDEYFFYYSGNRSIHLHTRKFVCPNGLDLLRQVAEEFNNTYGAQLDTSIYNPNSQFRVIGAKHRKTGLYKAPISEDATRAECIREAQNDPDQKEWPFELPSSDTTSDSAPRMEPDLTRNRTASTHYRPGIGNTSPLPREFRSRVLWGLYKEENLDSPVDSTPGGSSFAEPFSPYKKTGDSNQRSVIVMNQIGGIRQHRWNRDFYVPARINYAIGGGDGSFTRGNSKSLVELSPRDARKWDFSPGDTVVIIGGNSGSSRLFVLDENTGARIAAILEDEGRDRVLDALFERGYEVGSPGNNSTRSITAQDFEETEAAKRKREIEQRVRKPNYDDCLRVACRLLKIEGWQSAEEWFRNVMGADYDPEKTYERLKTIVETYPDYSHVDVPERSKMEET